MQFFPENPRSQPQLFELHINKPLPAIPHEDPQDFFQFSKIRL